MMRARLFLLSPMLVLAIAAAHAADTQVTIDNFTFSPPVIDVPAGARVVWTNHDDIPHTVTADEDPRHTRSPGLDTGDSYARVFAKPGTYRYFCSLHPRMQGTVVVR